MRFTSDELMFLTLMTNGPVPFGIFFDKIKKADASSRAETAKKELIQKGILTEEGITPKGFATAKMWEEYRYARKHLVMKNSIVGLIENRRCVAIYKDKNAFEVASGDSAGILQACLKEYPVLCEADNSISETVDESKIDYETFRKHLEKYGDNYFTIGVFSGKARVGMERFIYWDEKNLFSYDPHSKINKSVKPSEVRKILLEALDLQLEVLKSGV